MPRSGRCATVPLAETHTSLCSSSSYLVRSISTFLLAATSEQTLNNTEGTSLDILADFVGSFEVTTSGTLHRHVLSYQRMRERLVKAARADGLAIKQSYQHVGRRPNYHPRDDRYRSSQRQCI